MTKYLIDQLIHEMNMLMENKGKFVFEETLGYESPVDLAYNKHHRNIILEIYFKNQFFKVMIFRQSFVGEELREQAYVQLILMILKTGLSEGLKSSFIQNMLPK